MYTGGWEWSWNVYEATGTSVLFRLHYECLPHEQNNHNYMNLIHFPIFSSS